VGGKQKARRGEGESSSGRESCASTMKKRNKRKKGEREGGGSAQTMFVNLNTKRVKRKKN